MPGLRKNGNSLTVEEKNNLINELGLGAVVAVDPVSGVVGLNPDSASDVGGFAGPYGAVPVSLQRATKGRTWVSRHFSTSNALLDSLWLYVPVGGGYYSTFAVGKWTATAGYAPHLGRMAMSLLGTQVTHGAATKTGTWSTSTLDYAVGGNAAYSVTPGDQIQFSVSGHTLVARTIGLTNGGYFIAAIDGDWGAANRLPAFTESDYSAGLCRSSDIGKRYINAGSLGILPDRFYTLASGLSDGAHVVTFEATGTKPSYTSAARSYICAVVGCSSADDDGNLSGAKAMAIVEPFMDSGNGVPSAMVYTPEIEKSVTGTWEFLGEVHGGETETYTTLFVDSVDSTSLARGASLQGAAVEVKKRTTLANTDATGTPVCQKDFSFVASAYQPVPLVCEWSVKWLVAKRVRSSFSLMLPAGLVQNHTSGTLLNARFDQWKIGSWTSSLSDVLSNDNRKGGIVPAYIGIASGSSHEVTCYAAFLDGGKGVSYFSKGAPDFAFLHDRSDGMDKAYFSASTQQLVLSFSDGDVIGGVVGFGVVN